MDSLPAEPQAKPKNTGVGSLSLLQQIFPTQELNRCLLHCRWILYQLSYQESHLVASLDTKEDTKSENIVQLGGSGSRSERQRAPALEPERLRRKSQLGYVLAVGT